MSREKRISRRQLLRKVAAVSAGLALAGPILAACGPTPVPTATSAPKKEVATPKAEVKPPTTAPAEKLAATPAPAKKGVTEIVALERLGTISEMMEKQANIFNEKNPDIKVKVQGIPGAEYFQKIEIRAATQTLGDTFFNNLRASWLLMCDMGSCLELEPYLKAEGADLRKEFYPFAVDEAMMYKGKTYGIPEFSHPGFCGIYINKGLFAKAGVKYPDWDITFDKSLENAIKLTQDTNNDGKADQWGWMMPKGESLWGQYLYSFGGGYWFDESGTKTTIDSPGNMQALQWVYNIGYKHKAAVTAEAIQQSSMFMFASGKQAVLHHLHNQYELDAAIKDKFEWLATPFPYNPGTDDRDNRRAFVQIGLIGIYASTKHPQEAYRWLRYLTGYEAALYRIKAQFTPSPRPDVWNDPEMMKDPTHGVFKKYYESKNAHATRGPANLRTIEINDTLTAALATIDQGKKTPQEAIAEIKTAIQAVLDKPKP